MVRASLAAVFLQIAAAAAISLSPGSGQPGSSFVVSGSGFLPGDRVRVWWDGSNLGGNAPVDPNGNFTFVGTVPSGASPGVHTLEAIGRQTGSAFAAYEVVMPITTTTLSPTTTTAAPPVTTAAAVTTITRAQTVSTATSTVTTTTTDAVLPGVTSAPTASTSSTTPAPHQRQSGMNLIGASVVALLAAALTGGMLFIAGRRKKDRDEGDGDHEPRAVMPVGVEVVLPAVEGEGAGWLRRPLGLSPAGKLERLLAVSEGFIAVGQLEADDGEPRPALWRRGWEGTWNLLVGFDRGIATTAVVKGDRILVFGFIEESGGSVGCVWDYDGRSSNLLSDPTDPGLRDLVFDGAVVHDNVTVAYGRKADSAQGWVTYDGAYWERARLSGTVDLIASVPGALFGFGRDPVKRRPVVARSVDGLSWTELEDDEVFVFEGAAIAAVAAFDGGIVAAGTDKMRGTAAVWVSDDGRRWLRSPFQGEVGTSIQHLARTGDGLVAVGVDGGPKRTGRVGRVGVWESNDGVNWGRLQAADLFSNATVTSVAGSGGQAAIVGKLQAGPGSPWPQPVAVIWDRVPESFKRFGAEAERIGSTEQLVYS